MADIIQLLPDHVANQIAAGEVVQRPASVVKELMENAIDAAASTIKLVVKEGGKTLIQVIDDGVGMSATDARLSFERHATSKIRKAEDLFNLSTNGFRGEALASIAAIAHVEMQTRTGDGEVASHIRVEGSKIVSQEVTVAPKGTSMMVKNLFFNIPARRNFLKSTQVELRHIIDEFQRVALAHPSITFHFYNNGSEIFNLPASNHRQRIVNVFGGKTNEKLVPVQEDTQVVTISGYISKPEYAKKSRGEQFFFVNNRFIKSPYLHHAITAAFDGLIKKENHPGYFLYLTVDPASIDINIHPTKTEIKFDDEHTLYAIVRSTVKHSLGQFNVMPSLDFEQDQNLETPYNYKDRGADLPQVTVDVAFNPFKGGNDTGFKRSVLRKQDVKGWEQLYVGMGSDFEKDQGFGNVSFESDTITGSIFSDTKEMVDTGSTTFQLRRKYIVTTIKSGMVVIDQRRAHQRVLYERFLGNITVKKVISQQLLFPLSLTFSKSDLAILKEIQEELIAIGFIFEAVGGEELKVTGVPLSVPESEVAIILDQLVADYQQDFGADSFSQTDVLAKTLAKSLAVKTGELLDSDSRLALVNDLFACKEFRTSPFNKSIFVTITEDEIDKKFI